MDEVPRAFAISEIQSSSAGDESRVYASCVRSSMTYGNEARPLLVDVGLKFERADIQMIRWMCGVSMNDRRTSKELRRLLGVESIITVNIIGSLGWYVIRKGDDDWVKKCMEFRVKCRRSVGSCWSDYWQADSIFRDWIFYMVSVLIDMEVILEISDALHFVSIAWSFMGSV